MHFQLQHENNLSADLLAQHPIWAQYHEPANIEVIVGWGIARDEVLRAFEHVGWSDSYLFPVLESTDASRFYLYYAAASFQTAEGSTLAGCVSDAVPKSVWVFSGRERLLLSQVDPELTAEDESALRASLGAQPIYPLEVRSCVLPLQRFTLNPYSHPTA